MKSGTNIFKPRRQFQLNLFMKRLMEEQVSLFNPIVLVCHQGRVAFGGCGSVKQDDGGLSAQSYAFKPDCLREPRAAEKVWR